MGLELELSNPSGLDGVVVVVEVLAQVEGGSCTSEGPSSSSDGASSSLGHSSSEPLGGLGGGAFGIAASLYSPLRGAASESG